MPTHHPDLDPSEQTERYARNPDKPEDEDIEEISYFAEAIQIKYHRARE